MIDKDMMILTLAVNQFLIDNKIELADIEELEIDYNGLDEKNTVTFGRITFYITEQNSYKVENDFNNRFNQQVNKELGTVTTNGFAFVCYTEKVGV